MRSPSHPLMVDSPQQYTAPPQLKNRPDHVLIGEDASLQRLAGSPLCFHYETSRLNKHKFKSGEFT